MTHSGETIVRDKIVFIYFSVAGQLFLWISHWIVSQSGLLIWIIMFWKEGKLLISSTITQAQNHKVTWCLLYCYIVNHPQNLVAKNHNKHLLCLTGSFPCGTPYRTSGKPHSVVAGFPQTGQTKRAGSYTVFMTSPWKSHTITSTMSHWSQVSSNVRGAHQGMNTRRWGSPWGGGHLRDWQPHLPFSFSPNPNGPWILTLLPLWLFLFLPSHYLTPAPHLDHVWTNVVARRPWLSSSLSSASRDCL